MVDHLPCCSRMAKSSNHTSSSSAAKRSGKHEMQSVLDLSQYEPRLAFLPRAAKREAALRQQSSRWRVLEQCNGAYFRH